MSRLGGTLALMLLATAPSVVRAEVNIVSKVTARAEGSKTVVTVHGSATPSFTAYRLERPARVVVDLANGKLAHTDGPFDVDTWAVGQIATAAYADEHTRTARVMIGFKRPATYDVRAHGSDVIITVTPDEAAPAEALQNENAKVAEAARRRERAEQQAAATEAKVEQLKRMAEEAQKHADRARLQEEQRLKSLGEARAAEERQNRRQLEARNAEMDATQRAALAQQDAEVARGRAAQAREELAKLVEARKAEQLRLVALRKETQAEGEKSTQEIERLRLERRREQDRLDGLRQEAEGLARRRAEELKRLGEVQSRARREAEGRAEQLEAARRQAEERAQAAAQAAANAEAARLEEAKLKRLREESRKVGDEAKQAQAKVTEARTQVERLFVVQQKERARAEEVRREALAVAAERAKEARRAALAVALESRSMAKIEAAEREARRLAETEAHESARLEQVRMEMQSLAQKRAEEAKQLEKAREAARQLAQERQSELKMLAEARTTEEARLAELRRQAARAADEVKRLGQSKSQAEAANTRREAERAALDKKVAQSRSELERLDSEKQEASLAQSKLRQERDKLQKEREKMQSDLDRQLAETRQELRRVEAERLTVEKAAAERVAAEKVAAAKTRMREKEVASAPVAVAAPVSAKTIPKLRDIRFQDDGTVQRVVIELHGDADYSVLRGAGEAPILRLAGVSLPEKLERTLDATAYRGPVRSISSYVDSQDPGAVRIEVALGQQGASDPRLVRDHGRLTWEFARAATASHSYPPQRVGGFGTAPLPLQMAAAPVPLSQVPGTGGGRRRQVYSGRRIDLDFKDADIHNILRLLADVGQVNIVTSDDVKGAVTIRMRDVPWDQALDVILRSKNLGMQREGNLIRVAPNAALEKEMEQEIARARASVELKPLDTRLIPLSYADANQLMPRVQEITSPRGKVSVDARTNMLIVSDVAANIALAEDLVRNLDTQTPQVLIEARIVEARSNFTRTLGIQWGGNSINSTATGNPTGIVFPSTIGVAGGASGPTPNADGLQLGAASPNYVVNLPAPVGSGSGGALGLTLGSVAGNVNINLRLSALENTGIVRIISAPKITTLDNIEASIEQGVAIPISVVSAAGTNTVFVDAKLNLTVKPHVTNEGSVIMNVQITRNEPDFVNTGARGDPTILKKQARTEMLVRDGDTAVIGGIYTRNSGVSYNKVPWIADVPILGWLFKSRRENDDRSELLIFITPRVVNRQAVVKR